MRATSTKISLLILTVGTVVLAYGLAVRPWMLNWGSTAAEQSGPMPGDEIVAGQAATTTRAITIGAPAEKAFPWLAQLGQNRAGFYSFELLEDLAGADMPRAETLLPGAQEWLPGDSLWMYPYDKLNGAGGAPLVTFIPGRALAFGTWRPSTSHNLPPDGSWAFVIDPVDASTSRFLVRSRGASVPGLGGQAFDRLLFEPVHFVMERRMMEGIQRLAEGRAARSRAADFAEILVWAGMFAVFFWGIAATLKRVLFIGPLLVTFAAAIGFLATTLFQPPAYVGLLAVALLIWALRRGAPESDAGFQIHEDRLSHAAAR